MDMSEKTLEKNVIYEGKILTLRRDKALLPNGKESMREVVLHPGGACVLYVKEGKVALVKQFRYPYQEELWEIPAGKLEAGEDPCLAAKRELEEETGSIAKELVPLLTIYPSPGYSNEKIFIFEAVEAEEGIQRLDEDEFLTVQFVPLGEALSMVRDGRIKDAKTVAALLFYAARGK